MTPPLDVVRAMVAELRERLAQQRRLLRVSYADSFAYRSAAAAARLAGELAEAESALTELEQAAVAAGREAR